MQAQRSEMRFLLLLLRGIRDDLMKYAMPTLTSSEAKEHVQFAHLTLDRYCTDLDTAALARGSLFAEYHGLIAEAGRLIGLDPAAAQGDQDLSELRSQLSESVVQLSDFAGLGKSQVSARTRWLQKVLALETRLKDTKNSVQRAGCFRANDGRSDASTKVIGMQTLSAYLQRRTPGLPADLVTSVQVLPGGRSKRTVFVVLKPNDEWPAELVIRQDIPHGAVDTSNGTTSVVQEYPVLAALARQGIPIARPLLLEENETECGAGFMMVERLAGAAPGSFMGFFNPHDAATRTIVEDFARVLARIHRIDHRRLGLPDDPSKTPEDRLRHEIDYRSDKWRQDSVEPSPIMECALARLRAACQPGLGGPALVHGDAMAHNLLVSEGKISALVDWEFVHVGDPAQDLAYCRKSVEQVMPWEEFMSIYVASGGLPVSEKRLAIFGLVGLVRNCSFSATFARRCLNDPGGDVTGAEAGYFSIPMLESRMLELLNILAAL